MTTPACPVHRVSPGFASMKLARRSRTRWDGLGSVPEPCRADAGNVVLHKGKRRQNRRGPPMGQITLWPFGRILEGIPAAPGKEKSDLAGLDRGHAGGNDGGCEAIRSTPQTDSKRKPCVPGDASSDASYTPRLRRAIS